MKSTLCKAAAISLFSVGIASSGPALAQSTQGTQGQSAQQSSQGGQGASTDAYSSGNASAGQSSPRDFEQRSSGDDDSGNWGWLGLLGLIGLAGLRRKREDHGRTTTTAGGTTYNR